jgi:hypothetical protein
MKITSKSSGVSSPDSRRRNFENWLINFGVLTITVVIFFAVDRALLAWIGLPIWEWDRVLHYKHRPGATVRWEPPNDQKVIHINSHGLHDDEFQVTRAPRELRGVILGDSVVMGHGVLATETFASQMESILAERALNYDSYQIINTGVQGYSTFQYVEVLNRSLKFSPSFLVVGFDLNDVTEPYVANTSYGGTGLDYHGVMQSTSRVIGYLVNETGYGRLNSCSYL